MTNVASDQVPERFVAKASAESHFSWVRTRLSVERTLMSMQRTAVSLVGFGFTIVQFFDRLKGMSGTTPAYSPEAPRYVGLALIFCGVMALSVSVWQYHWSIRYLWSSDFAVIAGAAKEGKQTPLYAVSLALLLVGTLAFFAVLFRLV